MLIESLSILSTRGDVDKFQAYFKNYNGLMLNQKIRFSLFYVCRIFWKAMKVYTNLKGMRISTI